MLECMQLTVAMPDSAGHAHHVAIKEASIRRTLDQAHASADTRALDGIRYRAERRPVERFSKRFEFIAMQFHKAAIAGKTGLRKNDEADRLASAQRKPLRDMRDILHGLAATGSQRNGCNAKRGN
jgi:hypothetical protein